MATLSGKKIADTFDSILHVADEDGPLTGTLQAIEDGLGNESALYLATNRVKVNPTSGDTTAIFEVETNGGVALMQCDASGGNKGSVFNITGAADIDFRVEGDTLSHLIFADASADMVGIGESTPTGMLHISSTAPGGYDAIIIDSTANDNLYPKIQFLCNDTTNAKNNAAGYFEWRTGSAVRKVVGQLYRDGQDTTTEWAIANSYNISDASTVPWFIVDGGRGDAYGQVGIGVNAPRARLEIFNDTIDSDDYTVSDDYYGIRLEFIYTGSSGKDFGADDNIQSFRSYFQFVDSQSTGAFNTVYASWNTASVNDCADSGSVIGVYAQARMDGSGADVGGMRGIYASLNIDDGTNDSFGRAVDCHVDVLADCDAMSYVQGVNIQMNCAFNPSQHVAGLSIYMNGAHDDYFWWMYDDVNNNVRGHLTPAGVLTVDSSAADGASDYAEYFESKDGNAMAIGSTVKLDEGKLVACADGDTPLGVVRPKDASVVSAGNMGLKWQGKYLTDDYDAPIMEDFTFTMWKAEIPFSEYFRKEDTANLEYIMDDIDPENIKYYIKYQYHTDKIPADLTVPGDATIVTPTNKRFKVNPDYDESLAYVKREDRDEWCLVGLLGQVPITKGQPVASNWVKMKDISSSVEMWLIK